jgi:hypothetical protein
MVTGEAPGPPVARHERGTQSMGMAAAVAAHDSLVVLVVDLRGKMQHFDSVLRRHARPCPRLLRPTNSCKATLALAF